jgi:hypothetical protein
MCRNIRTLFNFDPPATELEIRDASLLRTEAASVVRASVLYLS